jgi:endothelin-converting enzyme/putative endopeptidase
MKRTTLVLLLGSLLLAEPTGSNLSGLLDPGCKPCEDLFKHVNGKWIDANPIPGIQRRWGRFDALNEGNREKLQNLLTETMSRLSAGSLTKGSAEEKMAHLYASCMDTATVEKRGLSPIQGELDRIAKLADRKALASQLVRMYEIGVSAPITMAASPDLKNAQEMILGIANGGLSLPDRDFYFREGERAEGLRKAFLDHVAKMHLLLGENPEAVKASASVIFEFEKKLAAATMTNVQRRQPENRYHRMDLMQAKALAPSFDWDGLLAAGPLPKSTPMNVVEPKFFEALEKELTDAPLETWKTYLRWRLVNATANNLPERFDRQAFEFQKVLTGVTEQRPRWQRCVIAADQSMGDTLGEMFVAKYFPPAAKRRMDELVTNMKATLADELSKAEWLSAETRKQALNKLNKINPKIGYPAKWKDYATVRTSPDTLLENLRSAREYERARNLAKIGKPIDKSDWGMTPPTVNAYYSPLMNEIAFPAGILQPPFFDSTADDAINYGAIGAVIGHEIGHGFDDQGSKFDADGNLRNWWTEEDRKKFEDRAACIVDQFESFEVQPGAKHIGRLVTGEALGDLGGLTLAYKAYQRSLNGKKAPAIDGLTGDQRFFIAFARVWGAHSRPESERLQLQTDPHPVAKSRTNETLRNMPAFHEAFKCQRGDAMVRAAEKQCRLW